MVNPLYITASDQIGLGEYIARAAISQDKIMVAKDRVIYQIRGKG